MDILEKNISGIVMDYSRNCYGSSIRAEVLGFANNKNSINITFVTLLLIFGVGIGACFSEAADAFSLKRTVYPDLSMA